MLLGKAIIVFKVNNHECLKSELQTKVYKKLKRYGFEFVFSKNNTLLSPNVWPLLFGDGVTNKNTPLFLYIIWMRSLVERGCLSVIDIINDHPSQVVVRSLIDFLQNGVKNSGFLWYYVDYAHRRLPDVFGLSKLMISDEIYPYNFVTTVMKTSMNKIHKLVDSKECCYSVRVASGKEFIVSRVPTIGDLHVFSLIKVKATKIERNDNTPISTLKEYPLCHPFNNLINNVNRHIFMHGNVRTCEVDVFNSASYSMKGRLGKTRMVKIASGIDIRYVSECIHSGGCKLFDVNDSMLGELLKVLILVKEIKENIIKLKFGDDVIRVLSLAGFNNGIIKSLFYPDVNDVIIGALSDYVNNWLGRFNDSKVDLVLSYRLYDNNIPYFVGLSVVGDRGLNISYQLFYLSPSVVNYRKLLYYDGEKYKELPYLYNVEDVIKHNSEKIGSNIINATYV